MSEPREVTNDDEPREPAGEGAAASPPEAAEAGKAPDPAKAAAPQASRFPLPARIAYPLAFLCGFLYFVAFPGIDVWPLSFVALAPLVVALRGQTPRRALGLGWLAGFTMTMFGFYWLLEMLRVFSGFGTPLCLFFMAILCAAQAGRIALCGWLHGRAEARGWPAAPVFALAFVASELVYPLLFPWYYGATVHNAPVFMQVADLGGPYLVGLVLVAANLGVAEIVVARLEARAGDRRVYAAAVAAPALALLYGYARIRAVDAEAAGAPPVKIGIVQGNQKLFDRKNAVDVHVRRTRELKSEGVDLVIWSEGATSRATRATPPYEDLRRSVTNRLGVPTVVGTILYGAEGRDRRLYNTAMMADAQGAVRGRYDKQYLLAFGEYIPFGDVFPALYEASPNSSRFSKGDSLDPLPYGDHKISVLICYEDILPGFVNGMVRHADPDLLVNMTNDAWFGDSTEPWIHLALAKMRAVEHRRYLVRATNTGVSALVDPVGRVPLHGGTFDEESLIGVAKLMRQKTVYEILGDWPWYLATAAIAGMAFARRERVMGGKARQRRALG